jgi:tetratricopeptide (TPR) repeat protein
MCAKYQQEKKHKRVNMSLKKLDLFNNPAGCCWTKVRQVPHLLFFSGPRPVFPHKFRAAVPQLKFWNSLIVLICFFSVPSVSRADSIPEWFLPFSDTVYGQVQNSTQVLRLYTEVKQQAVRAYSGHQLYTLLSHCEYVMGLSFGYEGQNDEAAAFFEKGIEWAEKSILENPSSEGYQMLAVNIALSCRVRPLSFILANGHKIERYAKMALALDAQNYIARYLLAAQYIHVPSFFANYGKGLQMLKEIEAHINGPVLNTEKEYRYNLYATMALAYYKLKRLDESRACIEKVYALYPTNKHAAEALR